MISAGRTGETATIIIVLGLGSVAVAVKRHMLSPYDADFEQVGHDLDLDANMLRAVAKVESDFRPDAVSPPNLNGTRDYGIMQINERTARSLGVTDLNSLFNVRPSIELAGRLFVALRQELGALFNPYTWVSAYNVGSPTVRAQGIVNPAYVGRVLYHWQMFALGQSFK